MTQTSIHEYVAAQRPRYLQASRRVKRRVLDEIVAVTGYHGNAGPTARPWSLAAIWVTSPEVLRL